MAEDSTLTGDRTTVIGGTGGDVGEFQIPSRVGPVRLMRQIGCGAMGVVWLGFHELLKKDVAVKFLSGLAPDERHLTQFLEGARGAAEIRHAGLTLIHNADVVDGRPYIVMDYVEGPTL